MTTDTTSRQYFVYELSVGMVWAGKLYAEYPAYSMDNGQPIIHGSIYAVKETATLSECIAVFKEPIS